MPQYKEIYNGRTVVLRKITKKQTGGAVKVSVAPMEIQTIAAPTKALDAKAMRAKLTAELFKTL